MKVKLLVVALVAMALFIGAAMAVPTSQVAIQTVNAAIPDYTITITGPGEVSNWNLERGVNNERDIGPVLISTTAPPSYKMHLAVTSDATRLYAVQAAPDSLLTSPMFISDATPPVPENGWVQLTTGTFLTHNADASLTPLSVPIRIRQPISTTDPSGTYKIVFTYTLSVTPP